MAHLLHPNPGPQESDRPHPAIPAVGCRGNLSSETRQNLMKNRVSIASWLFLIGSSLFTVDAAAEIVSHFSAMSLLHLAEGVLFLVGSVFFMPDASTNS